MIHIGEKNTTDSRARRLVVDGVEGTVDVVGEGENAWIEISASDPALIKAISSHRFDEFPTFSFLGLALDLDWLEWVDNVLITEADSANGYELQFSFEFSWESWNRSWPMAKYADELERLIAIQFSPGLRVEWGDERFPIIIRAGPVEPGAVIGEVVGRWLTVIQQLHETAERNLVALQHVDSVVAKFHFPPAVATACTQYLEYFVQFLADLGIQAEAEVQHKAAEVLFRVTPAEGREALERVRHALDAYLQLPTDPSLALVPSSGQDPAVWELRAVVRHLRDRVEFQNDVLEAKNATIAAQAHSIEALELSNFRLRPIPGGEEQADVKGAAAADGEDDSEAIIPGAVSVKRYEIGPIVVEIPEILRMLKRRFGR